MNEKIKNIDILEHIEILEPIFEQSYNFIVITSPELELPGPEFLYVNSAFCKATGYSKDEIKGKTPRILQGDKTNRDVLDRLKIDLKNHKFFQGSTINYRKDGSEYWVEWNISPIYDKNGNLSCYFCIQHDISTQKDLQLELERRLEIEIDKRLQQEQILIMQSKMAIMGEMIGVIAHQWQQPLSYTTLLVDEYSEIEFEDENIKNEVKVISDKILEQVQFMSETINDFKNFFKTKRNKQDFIIKEEIDRVLKLMKPMIDRFAITCSVEQKCKGCMIFGKPNEFKQVILNLISNSKDAYEERGVKNRDIVITISENLENIEILYRDNAGGIPKELLPNRIFESYVTTKDENGTGIGMSIVKTIIETNLNGKITACNTQDGAMFVITIPKKDREKSQDSIIF